MSRVCEVCGKKPSVGNKVSHANNKTKRIWYPNLQKFRVVNEKTGAHSENEGMYQVPAFRFCEKGRLKTGRYFLIIKGEVSSPLFFVFIEEHHFFEIGQFDLKGSGMRFTIRLMIFH